MTVTEPNCNHSPTVRVSSHKDIVAAAKTTEGMASAHCCDRPACRAEAEAWVREVTGRSPVTVPLRIRRPA